MGAATSPDHDGAVTSDPNLVPADPIAAVVHPDPGRYYDQLATRPLWRDEGLGLWVASSAVDVAAVLAHPAAGVRPPDAPIPRGLGGDAADLFRRLIRMHDRPERTAIREAIATALDVEDDRLEAAGKAVAAVLAADGAAVDGRFLDRWIAAFPVGVIAALAGITLAALDKIVEQAATMAAAFGPAPAPASLAAADGAVGELSALLEDAARRQPQGFAGSVIAALGPARRPEALANLVGLFFQAYDATAGLLGNVLVRMARHIDGAIYHLDAAIERCLRADPAVHNTRRFFVEPAVFADQRIDAGDCVLVVLATAARDENAGADIAFGAGAHRCPADRLARRIVELGVSTLPAPSNTLTHAVPVGYRPLPNTRVPVFSDGLA